MTNFPTEEQILNEPAGNRMDAWIAAFVVGLPRYRYPSDFNTPHYYPAVSFTYISLEDGNTRELFQPSSTWLGAGMVLDDLVSERRRNNTIPIGLFWDLFLGKWAANTLNSPSIRNKSPQLAICQVALLVARKMREKSDGV